MPTYERILESVELALSHGVKVSLRVNVGKENLHGIGALIDDLKARGFLEKDERRADFSYYFKAANDDAHPEKNIAEQDILDELMKYGFTTEEAIDLQSQYSQYRQRAARLIQEGGISVFCPELLRL